MGCGCCAGSGALRRRSAAYCGRACAVKHRFSLVTLASIKGSIFTSNPRWNKYKARPASINRLHRRAILRKRARARRRETHTRAVRTDSPKKGITPCFGPSSLVEGIDVAPTRHPDDLSEIPRVHALLADPFLVAIRFPRADVVTAQRDGDARSANLATWHCVGLGRHQASQCEVRRRTAHMLANADDALTMELIHAR